MDGTILASLGGENWTGARPEGWNGLEIGLLNRRKICIRRCDGWRLGRYIHIVDRGLWLRNRRTNVTHGVKVLDQSFPKIPARFLLGISGGNAPWNIR